MKRILYPMVVIVLTSLISCRQGEDKKEKEEKFVPVPGVFIGSDGKEHPTVTLADIEIMTVNLDVDTFLNGDAIPEAKTKEEWIRAAKNKQPAWCYYDNDPENGKKYGRIYNYYTFEDPRGVLPDGWRILDSADWDRLKSFAWVTFRDQSFTQVLKSTNDWLEGEEGTNASGLNILPGGSRRINGIFEDKGLAALFWSPVPYNNTDNYVYYISGDPKYEERYLLKYTILEKGNGFAVRLARDAAKK